MPVYVYKVEMTCEGCSNQVKKVLGKLDNIENIEIDLDKKLVKVTSELTSDKILEVIKKTGKETIFVGDDK